MQLSLPWQKQHEDDTLRFDEFNLKKNDEKTIPGIKIDFEN